MQLVGGILVLFSGVCLGFKQAFTYEEMQGNLHLFMKTIEFMIAQIKTEGATLPEAICKVSFRQDGEIGKALQDTAETIKLNEGKELNLIWKEQMKHMPMVLPTKIENEWIHLFDQTGFYDRDAQLKQLQYVYEMMKDEYEQMDKQKEEKCRLYQSMGFLISLFVIILLW